MAVTKNFEDLATLRLLDEVRARLDRSIAADPRSTSERDAEVDDRNDHVLRAIESTVAAIQAAGSGLSSFPTNSRVPGGRLFHRIVGRSVRRDTAVLAARLDTLLAEVVTAVSTLAAHVDRSVDAIASVRAHDQAGLTRDLARLASREEALEDALIEVARRSDERAAAQLRRQDEMEQVVRASIGSTLDDIRASVREVSAGTERIERWMRDREFHPWFSNIDFADAFRGERSDILLRYHDVADLLLAHGGAVIDLGCGRGELLELLTTKGGDARGVEYDPELVKFCRDIFLDVEEGTAMEALEAEDDHSLGGIALIQVVEHLTPQQLVDLIPVAFAKLAPGGLLAMETVNAISPFVYTRSFYLDPTHTNPIHHEYLMFLARSAGFEPVQLQWRSPVADEDRIPMLEPGSSQEAALVTSINARIEALNQLLFCPQDYLVIARKPGEPADAPHRAPR